MLLNLIYGGLMAFFNNFFSFGGPVLSIVQASIGMYLSIMLTKYISKKSGFSSKTKINQILLIITSIVIGIGTVLIGKLGYYIDLPPYLYYPIPLVIGLFLPKLIFKLNWKEFGIYIVIGTILGFVSHILFSLLFGYNNYMPFWKISRIW